MALPETKRRAVRTRLKSLDFSPWHTCWGVSVWRGANDEWKFAIGQMIFKDDTIIGLDAAVDFIMANGWEG